MKSKNIAESGILVALTIIVLYASSILPVSKLTILTIASCFIPIALIRTSIKNTILVYIASSLLSFFLIPTTLTVYYTCFFGIYGIIKYFIEKAHNIIVELILKLLSFNILFAIIYLIVKNFIVIPSVLPLWQLYIAAQVVFLIYDYALTLIITYFLDKIYNKRDKTH